MGKGGVSFPFGPFDHSVSFSSSIRVESVGAAILSRVGFFSCGAKVFSFRNNCPCYRHRDAVPKRHIRFTVTIATTRSTYIYADGRRGICGCFSGLLKSY